MFIWPFLIIERLRLPMWGTLLVLPVAFVLILLTAPLTIPLLLVGLLVSFTVMLARGMSS